MKMDRKMVPSRKANSAMIRLAMDTKLSTELLKPVKQKMVNSTIPVRVMIMPLFSWKAGVRNQGTQRMVSRVIRLARTMAKTSMMSITKANSHTMGPFQ